MKITSVLMLLALLAPASACGNDEAPGGGATERDDQTPARVEAEQPQLVATWSEAGARDQAAWLAEHRDPRVLEGAAIDEFLTDLPTTLESQGIDAIDPESTALLVAGFSECANAGSASITGTTVTYTVRKTGREQCVWAPIRVQVFAIARGVTLAE